MKYLLEGGEASAIKDTRWYNHRNYHRLASVISHSYGRRCWKDVLLSYSLSLSSIALFFFRFLKSETTTNNRPRKSLSHAETLRVIQTLRHAKFQQRRDQIKHMETERGYEAIFSSAVPSWNSLFCQSGRRHSVKCSRISKKRGPRESCWHYMVGIHKEIGRDGCSLTSLYAKTMRPVLYSVAWKVKLPRL